MAKLLVQKRFQRREPTAEAQLFTCGKLQSGHNLWLATRWHGWSFHGIKNLDLWAVGLRSYEIALQRKNSPWVESMSMVMVHGLSSISPLRVWLHFSVTSSYIGSVLWWNHWINLAPSLICLLVPELQAFGIAKLVSERSSSKPQIQKVFCCVFKLDAWNVQSTKTAPKTNFKPQTAYNLDLDLHLHNDPTWAAPCSRFEVSLAFCSKTLRPCWDSESLAISPRAERSLAPQTWRPHPISATNTNP